MLDLPILLMQIPTGIEWLIIIAVIVVILFFGARKIPELARTFGRTTAEFQKARIEAKREYEMAKRDIFMKGQGNIGREKLEAIADSLGIDYTNKNDDELRLDIEREINRK
jgi:sec-independent protein translocase protein TatA